MTKRSRTDEAILIGAHMRRKIRAVFCFTIANALAVDAI
jgi:hypothetical protein